MRNKTMGFLTVSLGLMFAMNAMALEYTARTDISKLFDDAIKDYAFPGGVLAAGSGDKDFILGAYGYHTYKKETKDTVDSLFDLASMTKVCATTPAVMKLYDEGRIGLDDPVVKYLPEFKGSNDLQTSLKSKVTIRNLLTHTSGFPPDNDVYKMRTASLEQKWNSVMNTPLAFYPGVKYIYSDVNMLVLQKIIEKVSGMPLDRFVVEQIYKPLGMSRTFFRSSRECLPDAVPTEFSIYTDKPLQGVVHDENARGLDGVAGHAGLFSTAADLSIYAKMLLNKGEYKGVRIFKSSTVDTFIRKSGLIPGSERALGWGLACDGEYVIPKKYRAEQDFILNKSKLYDDTLCSGGVYIDPDAIGHTGYTGTSIWISFKYNVYVILLTNRVFPFRDYTAYEVFRYWQQKINSSVWENLGFTEKNEAVEYTRPSSYHKAD